MLFLFLPSLSTITRHEREHISFHFISQNIFLTCSCKFLHPNYLFQCIGSVKTSSSKLAMVFCFQNCSDLLRGKIILVIENCFFANSWPSASNFKSFSRILEHFFSHSRPKQFWKQNTIAI